MKKFNICLLVFWLVVIFLLSNQDSGKSQNLSDTMIGKGVDIVASITKEEITPARKITIIENMSDKIRTLAHFTEYLILGILVINALKDYYKLDYKIWLYGLLFCIFYAIGDEIHQLFISGRAFQYGDIIVDTLGSILGSFGFFKLKTNNK